NHVRVEAAQRKGDAQDRERPRETASGPGSAHAAPGNALRLGNLARTTRTGVGRENLDVRTFGVHERSGQVECTSLGATEDLAREHEDDALARETRAGVSGSHA